MFIHSSPLSSICSFSGDFDGVRDLDRDLEAFFAGVLERDLDLLFDALLLLLRLLLLDLDGDLLLLERDLLRLRLLLRLPDLDRVDL